jgi:hypothetical protein
MTQLPWHISPDELVALRGKGGQTFVDFMSALIRAEAAYAGLKVDDVDTNIRVTIPDGGADAEVKAALGGPLAIDAASCWQFKATDFSHVSESEFIKEASKSEARRCIEAGYVYVFCVCHDAPPEKTNKLRDELTTVVRGINDNAPAPRLLNWGHLADWANRHPAIILRFFRRQFGHVLSYSSWLDMERAELSKFVAIQSRTPILEKIKAHAIDADTDSVLLSLRGPPGSGLSRLVAEALAATADRVIYIQDASTAVPTATTLVNHPTTTAILVIDNTPQAVRAELKKLFRGLSARFRILTIGNAEEAKTAASLWVPKLDGLELQRITEANFPHIPARHCRAIAHLAGGLPKLAAAMAMVYQRQPARFWDESTAEAREILQCIVPDPQDFRVLECLALFRRVGFSSGLEKQWDEACSLFGLETSDARRRALRLARSSSVVLIGPRYVSLRPPLFAKALFESMWAEFASGGAARLLDGLTQLAKPLLRQAELHAHEAARDAIIDWASHWLGGLAASQLANAEVVERLLNLIEIQPVRVLPVLARLIHGASDAELLASEEKFDGWPPRQHIYWKLGHLLERRATYEIAESALFRMAQAENRSQVPINNPTGATEVWAKSFHLFLSGTEVPYRDRLNVLRNRLRVLGDGAIHLIIAALNCAVEEFPTRSEASPFLAGDVRPIEWVPNTYEELRGCFDHALRLLGQCLQNPIGTTAAFAVLTKHGRSILRNGRGETLRKVLESVVLDQNQQAVLLGILSDFLFFEAKDTNEVDESVREYVDSIKSWRDSLHRKDLPGRVLEALSYSAHRDSLEDTSSWEEPFRGLAEELLLQPDTAVPILDMINGGDHNGAAQFALGRNLGTLDTFGRLTRPIFESARRAKSPVFVRGYITGIGEQGSNHDEAILLALEQLETDLPALAVDLNSMNTRLGSPADRALRLVRSGRLPPDYLIQVHSIRFGGELLTEALETVLSCLPNEPAAVSRIGLELLGQYLWTNKQEFPSDPRCLDAIWQVLEQGTLGSVYPAHAWEKLLERLSVVDRERAIRVACVACTTGNVAVKEEAAHRLSHFAKADPSIVLQYLGPLLLDDYTSSILAIGNHGAFLNELPLAIIRPWIEEHGARGARVLARHLSPPVVDDQGIVTISELTQYILDNFESDDDVFSDFCWSSHNGRWYSGDIAGIHDKEAEQYKALQAHPNRRVQKWAEARYRSSKGEAAFWRKHEEEEGYDE